MEEPHHHPQQNNHIKDQKRQKNEDKIEQNES